MSFAMTNTTAAATMVDVADIAITNATTITVATTTGGIITVPVSIDTIL